MEDTKTVLVTGGSRGIGRAIALKMAAQGANVAILYAGAKNAAQQTLDDLFALGVKAGAYQCNVANLQDTEKTIGLIETELGPVQVLVNNAGITRDGLLVSMPEDDFDDVLATNLKGAFNTIRCLYRTFIRQRRGRIINISSVVGLSGNAGQANYAASKAGLIGLTKSVAKELATRGVTCNAIAPGFIESDMTDALPEKVKETILGSIPAARLGQSQEVASLAAFLASEEAAYITGQVIAIDGGMSM